MKTTIIGWRIQTYTSEFKSLGRVKDEMPVEFGNSPIRDRKAMLDYIRDLRVRGKDFEVTPVWEEK